MLALVALGCAGQPAELQGPAFEREPFAVAAFNGRFVMSNNGDDTLSIVAPEPGATAERLPVGLSPVELEGPHHIAVDPDGLYLYLNLSMAVAGSGTGPHGSHGAGDLPGYVLKLDTATGRAVSWVQVDPNPGDNALSADGKRLFVTHYDLLRWRNALSDANAVAAESNLILIDTESMRVRWRAPLCPAAHGVRLSSDESFAYATCGNDQIAIVDLVKPSRPTRLVPLPGASQKTACQICPYALGVAPDGRVWVSSLGPDGGRAGFGRVDVFDPSLERGGAFDTAASIRLAGSALFASFRTTADAFTIYVPEQGAGGDFVRRFEAGAPGSASREIASLRFDPSDCVRPHMLWLGADARGYLICEGDHVGPGSFVRLDLESLTVVDSTPTGVFPDALAFVGER